MPEIFAILEGSQLTPEAKEIAKKIFLNLARAEAKAHGTAVEQVHFHEVGAIDSIVDIAAVAVCLDNLRIEEVIVPALYEGSGTARWQHCIHPVPVPATIYIVSEHRI